jgi:TPR repeat protein
MYHDGRGVTQDYAEAARWFRKAADQGYSSAQFNLGLMYYHGQGMTRGYAEAARWFRKAADQGDAEAQFDLGLTYEHGEGVPQDYVQSRMWLDLAASRASGDAQRKYTHERDFLAGKMTAQQIAEAQRLAGEWKPNAKKDR